MDVISFELVRLILVLNIWYFGYNRRDVFISERIREFVICVVCSFVFWLGSFVNFIILIIYSFDINMFFGCKIIKMKRKKYVFFFLCVRLSYFIYFSLENLFIWRVILGNDYEMVVYIYDSEIFEVEENKLLDWYFKIILMSS